MPWCGLCSCTALIPPWVWPMFLYCLDPAMVWPVFLYCLVEFRTFPTSNFSNPFSPSFLNLTLLKPSPSQLAACFCYTLYVCFCYTLYVRNSKSLKLEKFEVGKLLALIGLIKFSFIIYYDNDIYYLDTFSPCVDRVKCLKNSQFE